MVEGGLSFSGLVRTVFADTNQTIRAVSSKTQLRVPASMAGQRFRRTAGDHFSIPVGSHKRTPRRLFSISHAAQQAERHFSASHTRPFCFYCLCFLGCSAACLRQSATMTTATAIPARAGTNQTATPVSDAMSGNCSPTVQAAYKVMLF